MKKYILCIIGYALLNVECSSVNDEYYERSTSAAASENEYKPVNTALAASRADTLTSRLVSAFWHTTEQCFTSRFTPPATQAAIDRSNYWPQAHAIDVVIDAYIRTQSNEYLAIYDYWFEGMRGGQNHYGTADAGTNYIGEYGADFIDDMAWMALAMLRMYETHPDAAQGAAYLERAEQIYCDWIYSEWTEEPLGGGLKWKHSDGVSNGKNPCTNSPAAIVAAKLAKIYRSTDQQKYGDYLFQAKRLYSWVRATFYNSENKVLYDGVELVGGVWKRSAFPLSYTVGTTFGAAHLLYELTGSANYLTDAVDMAERGSTVGAGTMDPSTGCLRREGAADADGGLFKGIFIRYYIKLIADPAVPLEKRRQFHAFVQHNADVLWDKGLRTNGSYRYIAGADWAVQVAEAGHAGLQGAISGATLMEAVAAMPPIVQ